MQIVSAGQTVVCRQAFLDPEHSDRPLAPKNGYPRARCYLGKDLVAELSPEQSETGAGHWQAVLTVPDLHVQELTPLEVKWIMRSADGQTVKDNTLVIVQPSQSPGLGDQVLMSDESLSFLLPVSQINGAISLSFYQGNEKIESFTLDPSQVMEQGQYTKIETELTAKIGPVLNPYLTIVDYLLGAKQRLMFNTWIVTPQILVSMNALESSLNKARLENVIPQLEYSQADLLLYLQRGLNLFNSYSPNLTDFNGLNMQGAIFDAHLLCASYYALAAQLLAEGMLAFNFSGQAVTLDVDRTPALEGALGRIESQLNERLPKVKQMLLRRGISGGDGSNAVGSSKGFGHLVLSNAPTTNKAVFRPGFNRYFR